MELGLVSDFATFEDLLDEVDPPARAVELIAKQLISRARRVAKATVDAVSQNGIGFRTFRRVLDEVCKRGLHDVVCVRK